MRSADFRFEAVSVDDPAVAGLVTALTEELAGAGYAPHQTFGYSMDRLRTSGVQLTGAFVDDELVGVAGLEHDGEIAELKRFYVTPAWRRRGVASGLVNRLTEEARVAGATRLRLETGDRQAAAIAFYRRHGFRDVARFGPYVDSDSSVCMERALGGR